MYCTFSPDEYPWLLIVIIDGEAIWFTLLALAVLSALNCIITCWPELLNVLIPVTINSFAVIPAPTITCLLNVVTPVTSRLPVTAKRPIVTSANIVVPRKVLIPVINNLSATTCPRTSNAPLKFALTPARSAAVVPIPSLPLLFWSPRTHVSESLSVDINPNLFQPCGVNTHPMYWPNEGSEV